VQERGDAADDLAKAIREGALTADELERRYATLVFGKTGSYQETAQKLGRNWRTMKSKIDVNLLQRLRDGREEPPS
jgi:hypothetical protein